MIVGCLLLVMKEEGATVTPEEILSTKFDGMLDGSESDKSPTGRVTIKAGTPTVHEAYSPTMDKAEDSRVSNTAQTIETVTEGEPSQVSPVFEVVQSIKKEEDSKEPDIAVSDTSGMSVINNVLVEDDDLVSDRVLLPPIDRSR